MRRKRELAQSTLCRAQRSLLLCLIYEAREVVSIFLLRKDFRRRDLHTMFVINCDGVSGSVRILVLSYHHWDF